VSRCGCGTQIVNDTCACALGGSDNITVTGSGNVGDPYIPDVILDPAVGNVLGASATGLYSAGMLDGTSADRATLAPGAGERVLFYETDTDLVWKWDGANWQRTGPSGFLGYGVRTTDYTNATTAFTTVVESATIHVPDGLRPLRVTVAWPFAENTSGSFRLALRHTLSDGSADTAIAEWSASGDSTSGEAGSQGTGMTYVGFILGGLPEDDYKFQFKARSGATTGGTTSIPADIPDSVTLVVEEM